MPSPRASAVPAAPPPSAKPTLDDHAAESELHRPELERETTGRVESRFTTDENDMVKNYLENLYRSATESTWRSFIVDKSQGIVFTTTISAIVSFLWFVSLFGMLEWSVGREKIIGITAFCASFSFSSVINCHILPGQPLSCPEGFQAPVCIDWYHSSFPYDTTRIIVMQILGLAGTLVSLLCTAYCFYVLTRVIDKAQFRTSMRRLALVMVFSALVSLCYFVVYETIPYFDDVESGEACILLHNATGAITCVPVSSLDPPLHEGYAFTATVVIFVLSVFAAMFSVMAALREHYDVEKED